MSYVTAKKVTRFFANGKGFANSTLAYKYLAKKEIAAEVWADVQSKHKLGYIDEYEEYIGVDAETRLGYVNAEFEKRYPHDDCFIGKKHICRVVMTCPGSRTEPAEYDLAFNWCKAAYIRDIKCRIERMRKEDEEASK